ncbi:DNA cytosine methyltransferase [Variovorax sp. RO1]|uniref:DNA cytosine methyltransferase n=1 Tax=Variovorax sp. RO1 TaxID=2066034 RepID=UPI0015DF80B5|nr:DNA cytosine methyltransferase [Variovorax sp. RO1]
MTAYYNEFDPKAAAVLRELIKAGLIAPGDVDERSIEDVIPAELVGYTQCHFFAGFGVWSYALRRAGWSDDRAIWSASCPCQPFSQAGEGAGFADERHLWPHLFHLIGQRRPGIVVGEQVASKDADPWVDLVQIDVEALAYAFGAVAFPSAGVGAPHIRDRTYWMANANANDTRSQGRGGVRERSVECAAGTRGVVVGVANRHEHRCGSLSIDRGHNFEHHAEPCSELVRLADVSRSGRREEHENARRSDVGDRAQGLAAGLVHGSGDRGLADSASGVNGSSSAWTDQRAVARGDGAMQAERGDPGPTNGLWRDADWLFCRDGKWRPVEPGTFPLAHGAPARVGRLRGYGNAINAEAAKAFIEAVMETTL